MAVEFCLRIISFILIGFFNIPTIYILLHFENVKERSSSRNVCSMCKCFIMENIHRKSTVIAFVGVNFSGLKLFIKVKIMM